MSKSDDAGLTLKTCVNDTPSAVGEPQLTHFMSQVLAELVAAKRDRQRRELDETLQPLKRELSEFRTDRRRPCNVGR